MKICIYNLNLQSSQIFHQMLRLLSEAAVTALGQGLKLGLFAHIYTHRQTQIYT